MLTAQPLSLTSPWQELQPPHDQRIYLNNRLARKFGQYNALVRLMSYFPQVLQK